MKLWRCPLCYDGVRAPARMRRDNALRYCLKCSGKTGKLVARTCPSAEAERDRRERLAREAEVKKKAERDTKRAAYAQTERGWLEGHCARWSGLESFKEGLKKTEKWGALGKLVQYEVRITQPRTRTTLIRHEDAPKPDGTPGDVAYTEFKYKERPTGSTGRAWWQQRRFCLTAGTDIPDALATILHELAHLASYGDRHGDRWRATFYDAVEEVTGVRPQSAGNKHEVHQAAISVMRKWYATYEKQLTSSTLIPTVAP